VPESFRTRLLRWRFNLFPAYRGTGARVRYIAHDMHEIVVELPLSWRTRNYVGTIFGGSMYGAVDPMLMIMLIHCLGPGYTVWDKAATIRFLRPGKSTLRATFRLDDGELAAIRSELATKRSIDRVYVIDLASEDGTPHATVEKTIYVRNDEWSPKDGERR
jgi:acyl-coenzyme A thioesterase PaaI-like protein